MKTEQNRDGKLLGIVFRIFAFVFAASGLFMLQGLSEGLEPWVRSFMASTPLPEELRFHAASHGALIGILFSGSLLALLRKPQDSPLLLRFYFFGHLIFLATLTITDPTVAKSSFFVYILFGVVLGILYAVYSKRRELFRPSEAAVRNRTLLAMTGVALLGLLPFIINGIAGQFQDSEQQFRWGEGTALGLTMLYAGYLTATSRSGARKLGVILSIAYIYMGAASITLPDYPGSWGIWGGAASIVYGIIYCAIVLRQPRAQSLAEGSSVMNPQS